MDTKTLNSVLSIVALVLGAIGLVVSIMIMIGNESVIDFALYFTYSLLGAAAVIAILFGLFYFATSIRSNIPMLIGIVVFAIIAIVAYNVASSEVLPHYVEGTTPLESKLSGAGLMIMYVLIIAAVLFAVVGEVVRIFK